MTRARTRRAKHRVRPARAPTAPPTPRPNALETDPLDEIRLVIATDGVLEPEE